MQNAMSIYGQYGIIVPEASVIDGECIFSGNVLVQATHMGPQPCLQGGLSSLTGGDTILHHYKLPIFCSPTHKDALAY